MVDEVSGEERDLKRKQVTGLEAQNHQLMNGVMRPQEKMMIARKLCCVGYGNMLVGRTKDMSEIVAPGQTLWMWRKGQMVRRLPPDLSN